MVSTMREIFVVFVLLFVFEVVESGYLPTDGIIGYNGHDLDITSIFQRLDALERNVKFLQEKNRKLEEENHNIRDMLSSTCGCIPDGNATSQKYQVLDGAINVPMVKKEHAKRLLVEGSTKTIVAFRASLSKAIASVGVHQAIEYDNVQLNIGNAYDSRHGHLIAPVRGVYLISTKVFSNPGKRVVLELVHNGNTLAILDTGVHSSYSSESKALPVLLEKGDMVWVRTFSGFQGENVPGYGNSFHNYFAAVLLVEQ